MNEVEFSAALDAALPKLRNVIRKMVGHAQQCEDIVQDTLTKAWEKRDGFREEAAFSTWLCSIGVNCAQDFLRQQQRWREKAQVIYANECLQQPELGMEVGQCFNDPSISFDIGEHIAYCFSCVGRSMPPVQQAALVLKDVLELTSREGAKVLNMSESVYRQHLSQARDTMRHTYEGLCALVNKQGVCYQCKGLREGFPESRRGQSLDGLDDGLDFEVRLHWVKQANLVNGKTQAMHDIFWKRTEAIEDEQRGDEDVTTDCGTDA